jgi:hypothetical protein
MAFYIFLFFLLLFPPSSLGGFFFSNTGVLKAQYTKYSYEFLRLVISRRRINVSAIGLLPEEIKL